MAGRQLTYGGLQKAVDVASDAYANDRLDLFWQFGVRGKPGVNGDIQNGAEAVRMIADPNFELLGTNASSDDSTFDPEGGIVVQTDGADGDEVIILPHLDANQSGWALNTWGTDQQTRWSCRITTQASIANCIIWAGLKLTNTEVLVTDANQCFFRYEDDVIGGRWRAIYSIGGVDTAVDTGITVAADTCYELNIDIDPGRIARMYIDGVLVATSTPLTTAVDLIPYIGVAADGAAAAKSLGVRWERISRRYA